MKEMIEDFSKLGGSVFHVASGVTANGRLTTSIKVCRPHWGDALCRSAAADLQAEGLRGMREFSDFSAWLEYLNGRLSGYGRSHGIDASTREADAMGQQRWEQRWQRYRLNKFASLSARDASEQKAKVVEFKSAA